VYTLRPITDCVFTGPEKVVVPIVYTPFLYSLLLQSMVVIS
jgi:hypothetical protein